MDFMLPLHRSAMHNSCIGGHQRDPIRRCVWCAGATSDDEENSNTQGAEAAVHEHAQQLGLHRQPAVPLVSLAGFAAGPHMMTSPHQRAQGLWTSSPSRQHRQQGNCTAAVCFSSTTAAVADLHREGSSGDSAGQAAASSQQPGSSVRHPEQPAGATAAGANAWWDADGCFEYRAPLSTTVRRLKVGLTRPAGCWGSRAMQRCVPRCGHCLRRRRQYA